MEKDLEEFGSLLPTESLIRDRWRKLGDLVLIQRRILRIPNSLPRKFILSDPKPCSPALKKPSWPPGSSELLTGFRVAVISQRMLGDPGRW
jgi:hypothetical protein